MAQRRNQDSPVLGKCTDRGWLPSAQNSTRRETFPSAVSTIGSRCHELRIRDRDHMWRIVYRIDSDAVLILEIFDRKTAATPKAVIDDCRRRLRHYDESVR